MHLLGRVAPLFAPIHPAREPEHAEPKGPDRNRHQQHVNLEETHILRIHSRNLLSASLPNTCKKTPKAKQVALNSDSKSHDSPGCGTP